MTNPISSSSPSYYSGGDSFGVFNMTTKQVVTGVATASIVGLGYAIAARYRVANPSEYFVKTGLGIDTVAISKKTIQWPFQTATRFSIAPMTYPVAIDDAMSQQRIPFHMPTVWTISPKNTPEALANYTQCLMAKSPKELEGIIESAIKGLIRGETAKMTHEEIFSDREKFKTTVVNGVEKVLSPFGLTVNEANIAELADLDPKNAFFSEQKKRALEKVSQDARVKVAEAVKGGVLGEAEHLTETRKKKAEFEAAAVLAENEREKEIEESKKNLSVAKAQFRQAMDIANFEAKAASEKKNFELQQEVEISRKTQEVAQLQATDLARAEVNVTVSKQHAEAQAVALRTRADAELYAKQQEAAGVLALHQANAQGLKMLQDAAGGISGLNQYLLVKNGMLVELARVQAEAVKEMKPNVQIWNTGNSDSTASGALTDLFKVGMPLFAGIKQQTGYDFLGSVGVKKENPPTEVK